MASGGSRPNSAGFAGLGSISRSTLAVASPVTTSLTTPALARVFTGSSISQPSPARLSLTVSSFRLMVSVSTSLGSMVQSRPLALVAFSRLGVR